MREESGKKIEKNVKRVKRKGKGKGKRKIHITLTESLSVILQQIVYLNCTAIV